ncbi:hypothetical protein Pmani_035363 [Petrolisthes manimaculis]|uniref:Uncharacterized protein n=1 Tax=Petrolisthes manimaculis TaxID=1843537 RepID=A0AAE1NKR5_9EUCA|nr:hypothetical protein Pmani_035363 [Petrolisthes manimaculis]
MRPRYLHYQSNSHLITLENRQGERHRTQLISYQHRQSDNRAVLESHTHTGCKVQRLTDKVGESSSPSFPLSSVYPLALRSLPQPWQDFSFAFEDSGGFPAGSLKVSTFAGRTELSLAAVLNTFDTSTGQEQQLQRIQLSEEESGQASIRNWTFISFEVLSDKLSVSLRGLEELFVFGEVNASEFQRGVARVAKGHSLDVALGCTFTQLPQGNETSLYTTTPDPDDGDDDDDDTRSSTPVVVVILVLLGLILVVGVWYWRGRRRSRRASSEEDQQGEEMEGRTGRRENGGGGGGGGREGAGRPEERPLVEGSSAGGGVGVVVVGTQSETNTGGHRTPEGHTDDVRGAQNRNDTQRNNTENSDGEEAIQGTYYATQSEIKKSTQSIYEPE